MNTAHTSFQNFLDTQLNNQQLKAVTQSTGSLLVVAGAGSGKTRIITARIANLIINEKVEPTSILAVTFTNKAANEMKGRILKFLNGEVHSAFLPFIGTFHSYCLRLLKQHSDHLRHPFVSILDEDDQQKVLSGILKRNNLQNQITAKQVAYQISYIKNRTCKPHDEIMNSQPQLLQEIYECYEREKKESKSLDFDDLLLETVHLLSKNKEIKQKLQQQIRHILVDEYQDTNVTQHELLKLLALQSPKKLSVDSMCVVGDEDQSIYSWRGATVTNILNVQHDFPKTKTIKIEQNYRSVQQILDAANNIIKHNQQRNPKTLWSARKGTNRICTLSCLSEYQEAEAIAQALKLLPQKKERNAAAVLYRAHYQSRAIEEALIRNSIPYTIIGGITFYERKEIKDLLAYLRLIVNPFDRTAFFRIINCPTRGLGKAFEEQFYEAWHEQPFLPFPEIAKKLIDEGNLTQSKKSSLKRFITIFEHYTHTALPSKALDHIIKASGYLEYLRTSCEKEEAEERIENIKELLKALQHFETNNITTTEQLLDEISLMQERMRNYKQDEHPVLLMTLHAAKGLEFEMVIIAGLEEGIFPSSRSLESDETIEEERRLLYVGITRAEDRLILAHSRYRYTYGQMTEQRQSRFLKEIPSQLSHQQDISYWNPEQVCQFLSSWLDTRKRKASSILTFGPATTQKPKKKPVGASKAEQQKLPSTNWKKNQPVSHPKFGIGIVKKIEEKSSTKVYLTISFKSGTKKIDAQFVKKT